MDRGMRIKRRALAKRAKLYDRVEVFLYTLVVNAESDSSPIPQLRIAVDKLGDL